MILNYNCYQVQQGDLAPTLGFPLCRPPPTLSYRRSVNWSPMTRPPLAEEPGWKNSSSLPLLSSLILTPPMRIFCVWVTEGGSRARTGQRPLPCLQSLVTSPLLFGRQPGAGPGEYVFTCKHMDTVSDWKQAGSAHTGLPRG